MIMCNDFRLTSIDLYVTILKITNFISEINDLENQANHQL